jgi:hypothetical protein
MVIPSKKLLLSNIVQVTQAGKAGVSPEPLARRVAQQRTAFAPELSA